MKPKLWISDDVWAEDAPVASRDAIAPEDNGPEFTGIYNADGDPLYRPKDPVGFRIR